jgi:hypothetical protein
MNRLTEFSTNNNLELLWDLLLDELNIKTNNNLIQNVKTIFEANIKPFVLRANPNKTLINLNKEFLSQVIIAVNKLIPQISYKKINITNEEAPAPYTIENIQATRQNNFETELALKQQEFEQGINPPKPQLIDFSFEEKDTKITEMDKLITETINRRKYDIENILKPIKKVSWDNNTEYFEQEQSNHNIFDKLKKMDADTESIIEPGSSTESIIEPGSSTESIIEPNIYNELTMIHNKIDEILNYIRNK